MSFFLVLFVLIVFWNWLSHSLCHILERVLEKAAHLEHSVDILHKPLFHPSHFLCYFCLQVLHLLVLVLFPFHLFSQLFCLISFADCVLSSFDFVSVLSYVFLVSLVHVFEWTVLGSVSLILLENFVHHFLSIPLILPTIISGVPPVLTGLRRMLVVWMEILIVVILSVSIVRLRLVWIIGLAWSRVRSGFIVLLFEWLLAEHLVGFVDFFEFLLVASGGIWMVLFCEFSESSLYLFFVWAWCDPQDFVVVFWCVKLTHTKPV